MSGAPPVFRRQGPIAAPPAPSVPCGGVLGSTSTIIAGGVIGNALSVNDTQDPDGYAYQMPMVSEDLAATNWSVAMWVRIGSFGSEGFYPVYSMAAAAPAVRFTGFDVYDLGGGIVDIESFVNPDTSLTAASVPFSLGNWHQVVMTVDTAARVIRFYTDNVLRGTSPAGASAIVYPAAITQMLVQNAAIASIQEAADYDVDDLRVYNRRLLAADVTDLFNLVNVTSGLISHCTFD